MTVSEKSEYICCFNYGKGNTHLPNEIINYCVDHSYGINNTVYLTAIIKLRVYSIPYSLIYLSLTSRFDYSDSAASLGGVSHTLKLQSISQEPTITCVFLYPFMLPCSVFLSLHTLHTMTTFILLTLTVSL